MFEDISVIVLAAGESQRMGRPKLLLPWGDTTVLGQVVATFAAGVTTGQSPDSQIKASWEIVVVTGGARQQVETLVAGLAKEYPLRAVYNPNYTHSGMLGSIQMGLQALGPKVKAAMIGLGDQPQVQAETIRGIYAAYVLTGSPLVIPSFHERRGHPWLVARPFWPEILALPASTTPRQFLNTHADQIQYVPAGECILQDLDTPEDYNRLRP